MRKAVHFGAGNIGRGFIGLLLSKAGYDVIFVDKVPEIINAINDKRQYTVAVMGEEEKIIVKDIRGVLLNELEVSKAITGADIITTAVGPEALRTIALYIAAGLRKKVFEENMGYLNIIACENKVGASEFLKQEVYKLLSQVEVGCLEPFIGFPNAVIDRIVPSQTKEDLLSVKVGSHFEWITDEDAFRGPIPKIPGMHAAKNLQAYVERKLYTLNTGHAVAAYLGYIRGYQTVQESLKDEKIIDIVKGAMKESGKYLVEQFGFSLEEHERYIKKTLSRFQNPDLIDEVARVGRKPLRKLGREDRLVFPALKVLELGEQPLNLAIGIAAALKFDYKEDEEACEIQQMIKSEGVDGTLSNVCGIPLEHTLIKMVKYLLSNGLPI